MDLMQSLIASRLLGDGGGGGSATLITKSVTQNGTYSATDDQADGYSEVSVDVQPSLDTKTITTNGTYPASSENLDGYSSVTVNVPDIPAVIQSLSITENGTYTAPSGVDGYNDINVEVPDIPAVLDDITITENGNYTPPSGTDGYNDITVSVPHPAPVLDDITISENGSYQPPTGVDGYDNINVNVLPTLDNISITANGTYQPPSGVDGYNNINVNVPAPANALFKQTLSGLPSPIATFTGADAPLDSLKASIEGVQDLHGYDSPWPAGGGKNKLPITVDGITSATIGWVNNEKTINGIKFTIHTDDGGNFRGIEAHGTSSAIVSLRLCANFTNQYNGMKFNGCTSDDNNVFLSFTLAQSPWTENRNISGDTNIFIGNDSTCYVLLYIGSGKTLNHEMFYPMIRLSTVTDPTFAPYSNICPISGWTSCEVTDNNDTYTIPFKDSSDNPITVYDGGIDITGGSGQSLSASKTLNGSENVTWAIQNQTDFQQVFANTVNILSGVKTSGGVQQNAQFDRFKAVKSATGKRVGDAYVDNGWVNFVFATNTFTDSASFKTWLSSNNVQVKYELATPIVMNFDPLALRSDGVTNISVDCGEVTELKYFSETILYNANNLQIANTSTYITANLNVALEIGKTYIGIIKDYGDWSNVPFIFKRVSGNQSITVALAQGSGTLVFTDNTVTLNPYAGDYRNIYLTLREYII